MREVLDIDIRFCVSQIFINNEWHKSVSGKTFQTLDPRTEEPIADVQEGDKARREGERDRGTGEEWEFDREREGGGKRKGRCGERGERERRGG